MMKKQIVLAALGIALAAAPHGYASPHAPSKKTGGIYSLMIRFDEKLTTEYESSRKDRNFLSGFSVSSTMPEELLDSIRVTTEYLVGQKFGADVRCLFRESRKGKRIASMDFNGQVEGMPANTFKQALELADLDLYIDISVDVQTGGASIEIGDGRKSKVKPYVRAAIKVFDRNKQVLWENKIKLKNLASLRSVERSRGPVVERFSETLGPADLYMIYEISLVTLLQE